MQRCAEERWLRGAVKAERGHANQKPEERNCSVQNGEEREREK